MAAFRSLADIELGADEVVIRPRGWYKLWALKRELRVPRHAISHAGVGRQDELAIGRGLRMPGTGIPGVLMAGTFIGRHGRQFWLAGRATELLVLELNGQQYQRVVVQVEQPAALLDQFRR